MKLRNIRTLARSVVLESIRRKDLWVVAILGFLIMLCAGALGFFGLQGLESFAKDLGTTVVGIFSTIIAVLTTARLLPEELKNRTLYPLIARPVSRLDLIAGKLWGAILVTWISFLTLAALTAVSLTLFQVRFEPVMLQYLVCKMLGLGVVCSVTLMLSIYMTPSAAATLSCVLAFGSGMIVRALVMAVQTSPSLKPAFQAVNAALPQYGLFDLGSRAANSNWGMVPAWVVGALAIYAFAYCSAMVGIGWAKFRKQAV